MAVPQMVEGIGASISRNPELKTSSTRARKGLQQYRVDSLTRNTPLLGPYRRTTPRALWWPEGGGLFCMNEEPL